MTKTKLTHQTSTGLVQARQTHHDYTWVVEISHPHRPDKRNHYKAYDEALTRGDFGEIVPDREERVHETYRRAVENYDRWTAEYGTHATVLSWHSREDLAVKAAQKAESWLGSRRTARAVPVNPVASKPKASGGLTTNQLKVLEALVKYDGGANSFALRTDTGLSGPALGGVIPSLVQKGLATNNGTGYTSITREGKEALA